MNVLFWNIRGIGNAPSQDMLKHHVVSTRPRWFAIAEPKVPSSSIPDSYWNAMGMRFLGENTRPNSLPNLWVLEDLSSSGSSIIFSSSQVLVIKVSWLQRDFLLAFIHAHADYICRRDLWRDLLLLPNTPLLLVGDFNAVIGAHERSNGTPPVRLETMDFRSFINDGEFLSIPSSGCFFTWSNRRFSSGYLETRIDRALSSQSFLDLWDSVMVRVGLRTCSDHSPLFVSCVHEQVLSRPRPFRFQAMWLSHSSFEELIKLSWKTPITAMGSFSLVIRKLKRLKSAIIDWNINVFGELNSRLLAARNKLELVQQQLSSMFR